MNNSLYRRRVAARCCRIFENLEKLAEHTIGSAINILTRAYNVCANSDFVFDTRPRRSPLPSCSLSISLPLFAVYFDCITFSAPLASPVCRKNSCTPDTLSTGRFLFFRGFYAFARIPWRYPFFLPRIFSSLVINGRCCCGCFSEEFRYI